MKLGTVHSASFDGTGFSVFFDGGAPSINNLGIVIGYAKTAQRKSGRKCFAISETLEGWYFDPADPAEPEELRSDLVFLLNSIGFDATAIVPEKSPPTISAKATAPGQMLSA